VCWGEGEVVHVWKVKEECACVMGGVFKHGLIILLFSIGNTALKIAAYIY